MIESFFVTLDAFPTKEVLAAVRADEFNHVIGESITTLATFDCLVFRHSVFFSLSSSIIKHHSGDSKTPRYDSSPLTICAALV
jgi:hypothetical protein